MHIISIFVILSIAILLISYISYPFRSKAQNLDRLIEVEVEKNRKVNQTSEESYCPQCGNRLAPSDRFCSQCGLPVEK